MSPEERLSLAESIAREAHAGQKEESTGDDYIRHVERVVLLVEGSDAKCVAWLHDVIEDTDVGMDALSERAMSEEIIAAVALLTRDPLRPYAAYIQEIKTSDNPLAVAVKRADLKDHLRPNCPERLRPRYEQALKTLSS